jgi:type I restriction enzyme R subunit
MKPSEQMFEDEIETSLLESGYQQSQPSNLDPELGLDTTELFAFIGATQMDEWNELLDRYGLDAKAAQHGFARRVASEIDSRGTVAVLRQGVVDLGVTIQLAFFKPAHGLTPTLQALYERNRVTITRQFPYASVSNKTIDMALLVNGIPTATAELKNPLTNQTIEHAIEQYRNDRDPKNLALARRVLVHFAVDPERVAMTTRLAGAATEFLPFNLGHDMGAGNPPNPNGHRTSYLWERVWARNAWMDLLARFIHVQRPSKRSPAARRAAEKVIFPRFHQWDAVLALEADAKANGAGHNYLIEHSAGSGKSNTIAWTAHRLSSLHDDTDTKVFDKVIVITDRVILDRQLQETIYQFERTRGVVVKIDKDSSQLAKALTGEQARIVVTTLQKFPFVVKQLEDLPQRRYAVIVDEAHSSQTGETAKDLRLALGGSDELELTAAEAEDAGLIAEAINPAEEALARAVGARGPQPNLSFFAFTATPKARTLNLFGVRNPVTEKDEPFHLYSMRQAIEEGFILDVLAGYTTYRTYWNIEKTIAENPLYEAPKAGRAIARFVALHPTNLAQKAEIVIEHFRAHTAHKIGGQAKAMVVTSSRLHAVRYKQAIDAYLERKGYTQLAALVAFSGTVIDEKKARFTEKGMNALPEAETATRFAGGDFQVLIVAEKFQTGFDQPLLHTMYVDKVLTGLNAVQTLSRLNRKHEDKSDTFVLDFRNETEDIVKAFEPYYRRTVAPPTDPNLPFDTRRRLDDFDVLRSEEIEAAVALLLQPKDKQSHARVHALLDPAVERFRALDEENRLAFKDALDRFVRTYSFVSQVIPFTDSDLERDYTYCRALAAMLKDASLAGQLDLGEEIELTHLRNELTFQGDLSLSGEDDEVQSIYGEGAGRKADPAVERLSEIVEELNERFGLDFDEQDRLLFDQFEQTWLTEERLLEQARSNTLDNFRLAFDDAFMHTIVSRMDDNEAIFKRILDDPEFRQVLLDFYANRVYRRAREPDEQPVQDR